MDIPAFLVWNRYGVCSKTGIRSQVPDSFIIDHRTLGRNFLARVRSTRNLRYLQSFTWSRVRIPYLLRCPFACAKSGSSDCGIDWRIILGTSVCMDPEPCTGDRQSCNLGCFDIRDLADHNAALNVKAPIRR